MDDDAFGNAWLAKKNHIIDRLNLDEKEKEIIIYDYKSGVSMDLEQLERYERVIRKKVGDEYRIRTKFLKLEKNKKKKLTLYNF